MLSTFPSVVNLLIAKLELNKDLMIGILHMNLEKEQCIMELTNGRIRLWGKWNHMKDGYNMDCFGFLINGKASRNGLALDENDLITILISDKQNKNFFTFDAPKEWDPNERKNEKYRIHKVNEQNEITEIIDLNSWNEFLQWYQGDINNNDELSDDVQIAITI